MAPSVDSFVQHYRSMGLSGKPMVSATIARLETHWGRRLPAAYHAYLLIAGDSPPRKLVGSDCHADRLFELHDWAIELLSESQNPLTLPEDAIVFLMHQGYQFFFIRADGTTEDPPVYYYVEDRLEFERTDERFSDWVAAIA